MQLFQYATLTLYQQQNPDDVVLPLKGKQSHLSKGPTEEDGKNKQNMNCMDGWLVVLGLTAL